MTSLKVQIEGVYRANQRFVVALTSEDREKVLPIFISGSQAQSIGIALSEKEPPRPLTHDILLQIIEDQDLTVERVTVDDLFENTFTAELKLSGGDETFPYDVRPSDAIALAARMGSDIYVSEDVMDRAGENTGELGDDSRELALKRFKDENRD